PACCRSSRATKRSPLSRKERRTPSPATSCCCSASDPRPRTPGRSRYCRTSSRTSPTASFCRAAIRACVSPSTPASRRSTRATRSWRSSGAGSAPSVARRPCWRPPICSARSRTEKENLAFVDVAVGEVGALAAVLLVDRLAVRELVVLERAHHLRRVAVEAGVVAAEDRGLHRTGGGPHWREAVFLLDLLGDFHAAQRLDLPLRRAGPERVGAPHHVVGAHVLDHVAEHERGDTRLRHVAVGEDLAEVGVDVAHAILPRDVGEVADPVDAALALQLVPRRRGGAARAGDPAV